MYTFVKISFFIDYLLNKINKNNVYIHMISNGSYITLYETMN